tara:strand:- start:209 stop:1417 length:1209 start_codon:yes stop_codon:yes gene_type:complete
MRKLISKIIEIPENIKFITMLAIVHVLTLVGVIYYWETFNSFWLWIMIIGILLVSTIGSECYLHRYCSHDSYQLSKPLRTIIHFFSIFNLQGDSVAWKVMHKQHHKYPDQDGDPHPAKGGWRTWFWLDIHKHFDFQEYHNLKSNEKDEMKIMNDNYWKIYFSVIIISTLIDPRLTILFFFIPAVKTLYACGLASVVTHIRTPIGYRNFNTPDNSRNIPLPFIMGNPYHNNHHNDEDNYNTAIKWYELDHIAWVINLLMFVDNLFKNCGMGASHVINKDNQVCIKRWGIWTSYFTIFFSKILPLKEMYNIEQLFHSHQANFVSFILKGVYIEDVLKGDVITRKEHKWFNHLTYDCHHRVICYEPVYTLMFMGRKKSNTTVRLKSKGSKLKYDRFFKLNDEEKI